MARMHSVRSKGASESEAYLRFPTGTCTDVHESIEAKLEAKRIREQLLSVIAHSHVTVFTVDSRLRVTMIEGALIWNARHGSNGSRWFIGENVYDVFNALNPLLPEGQHPPFLANLESIIGGELPEDLQEHQIRMFTYLLPVPPSPSFA